jgi:phosphoenolpyruvate carboxylase
LGKATVDVVPLFESVEDLLNAHNIMEQLYTNPMYANHLENRDETNYYAWFLRWYKDGGYLMANWSIYR